MSNWQSFLSAIEIQDHEVHIIGMNLNDQEKISSLYPLLSTDEQNRAKQFKFDIHRTRFILAHGYLRQILSKYLSQSPEKIQFKHGKHGKPYILDSQLQFNLSHSEDQAVIAITKNAEIGVDIEVIKKIDFTALAKRFFSEGECQQLDELPDGKKQEGFYRIWAQKEAYIKATGEGLSAKLDSFSVNIHPAGLIHPNDKAWTMQIFDYRPHFISAFASKQIVNKIYYWAWN